MLSALKHSANYHCLQVFTSRIPWHGYKDGFVVVEVVVNNKRPPRPDSTIAADLNDSMWDRIQDCWKTDPKDRPEITTIVECLKPGSRTIRMESGLTIPSVQHLNDLQSPLSGKCHE